MDSVWEYFTGFFKLLFYLTIILEQFVKRILKLMSAWIWMFVEVCIPLNLSFCNCNNCSIQPSWVLYTFFFSRVFEIHLLWAILHSCFLSVIKYHFLVNIKLSGAKFSFLNLHKEMYNCTGRCFFPIFSFTLNLLICCCLKEMYTSYFCAIQIFLI